MIRSKISLFVIIFISFQIKAQKSSDYYPNPTLELDSMLNDWHRNAASSNLELYFGFMSEDFVFLGTDPTERWEKEKFKEFCLPYFKKKTTWDFKPIERHWNCTEDQLTYWFDERIQTWMGDCRGSGVIQYIEGRWYIKQYNLAVLIENEKMDDFIRLRNDE